MVGPFGDWIKHDVHGAAALAPDVDGVRVLAAGGHDMLRRVPDELVGSGRRGWNGGRGNSLIKMLGIFSPDFSPTVQ